MNDRLRRLDALFAEKVLGLEPVIPVDFQQLKADPEYSEMGEVFGRYEAALRSPRPYTRSLDAAWEGMTKIHLGISETRELWDDTADGSKPYHAKVGDGYGRADHPAEALVLACLRAVGVPDSEFE